MVSKAYRKMLVGSVALLLCVILSPETFGDWMLNTAVGIALSTLFLLPVASVIVEGKRVTVSATTLLGILIFLLYFHYYLNDDVLSSVLFLSRWLATFAFISVIVQKVFYQLSH